MKFTLDYTNMIARQLGYRGNLHEFWLGMKFESENRNVKPRTNTKSNDFFLTTKNRGPDISFNDTSLTAKATIAPP